MSENEIGLMIQENRAFVEKAAWYVMCIVNISATVDHKRRIISDEIGTGTACAFKGHKIILTAKHVLRGSRPDDLSFLVRVGQTIDWDSNGKREIARTVTLNISNIVRCVDKDLAAIELNEEGLEGLNVRFCELPKKLAADRSAKSAGGVLLIGYPFDQTFEVSEVRNEKVAMTLMASVPTPYMGEIVTQHDRPLPSSHEPDRDVLIRYDPADRAMQPHGFSGAGVWVDPASRSGGLWTADPILFGIQNEAYFESRLLNAIGAPAIREFS